MAIDGINSAFPEPKGAFCSLEKVKGVLHPMSSTFSVGEAGVGHRTPSVSACQIADTMMFQAAEDELRIVDIARRYAGGQYFADADRHFKKTET